MSMSRLLDDLGHLRKGWRPALLASLLVNLFLIALIGGHLLHSRMHVRRAGSSIVRALTNAGAALSEPDATVFNTIVRRDAPQYAAAAQRLAKAREELRHQIAANPFDADATRQSYAAWQESLNDYAKDIGSTMVDALDHISPEGRRKILDEQRPRIIDPPQDP
jgi:uncharacterized membrane protein